MIRYCQMVVDDELEECGFLIGARCKADPENPFWVTFELTKRLKIVGCNSWQRNLDYDERRKRHGENSVGKEASGNSKEGRPERTTDPLCGLPLNELENNRACRKYDPVPMRVLSQSTHSKGNPNDNKST